MKCNKRQNQSIPNNSSQLKDLEVNSVIKKPKIFNFNLIFQFNYRKCLQLY